MENLWLLFAFGVLAIPYMVILVNYSLEFIKNMNGTYRRDKRSLFSAIVRR